MHLAPIAGELDLHLATNFSRSAVLLTLQGSLRRWDADGRVHFKPLDDLSVLRAMDVVVFSEEDIAAAPDIESEVANTTRCVVVTRAERGGTLYIDGVPQAYETPQVELVHPTGAGDVFAAAFLASFKHAPADLAASAWIAARLAAISVTRVGLDSAPRPAEVQAALAQWAVMMSNPQDVSSAITDRVHLTAKK